MKIEATPGKIPDYNSTSKYYKPGYMYQNSIVFILLHLDSQHTVSIAYVYTYKGFWKL